VSMTELKRDDQVSGNGDDGNHVDQGGRKHPQPEPEPPGRIIHPRASHGESWGK
jgi:hypothetical protein